MRRAPGGTDRERSVAASAGTTAMRAARRRNDSSGVRLHMAIPDPTPPTSGTREIRAVGANRALAWYSEALRLFKQRPVGFALLAVAVTIVQLLLQVVPLAGPPAANVIVPIVAASLLFASLATDRGDRPRAAHLVAPFAAPVQAVAAVIVAALAISGAEWVVAWQVAGVNMLSIDELLSLSVADTMLVYAAGVAVSLPLTLVPLFAFFEGAGVRDAFRWSASAFSRNVAAFLLYGGLSIALLGVVFVTQGIAAPIVLPLWAASSYAAWKDLCGLSG